MKLKNLLQGRLGRLRYFSYLFITAAIFSLLIIAYRNIFAAPYNEYLFFIGLFFLPIIILTIRRLHDLNLNGWWALLIPVSWATLPAMFMGFAFSPSTPFFVEVVVRLVYVLTAVSFSFLFLWKGTSGSNRFGEAPLR
ncbi:MAG: DUF805 domain-containing protein [Patescibacteria group bacterium]